MVDVEVTVNAPNSSLFGDIGVDGAIQVVAGSGFFEECIMSKGCPTEEAGISGAYKILV